MIPREELLRARRIASRVNPRVKDWASLTERKERRRLGLTLAEGARLVLEGLACRGDEALLRPAALLISDSGAERPEAGEAFERAGAMGLERYSLSDDCFAKVSGLKNADGLALILSFAETAGETELSTLLRQGEARWLVAAGVQDPGNAGALARTALAAGCDGCLFLDGADPLSPKFLRGSMGAAFRLPCVGMAVDDFLAAWPGCGTRLVMASTADAADYRTAGFGDRWALLVGGERGVPDELAALSDTRVHIPLQGGVESLNLAVAAGIILFEAFRPSR